MIRRPYTFASSLSHSPATHVRVPLRHCAEVRKYFTDEDPADQHAVWERMKRETYLFHYWNKITVKLTPSSGSLMYKVLNNFCLFCDDTGPDG